MEATISKDDIKKFTKDLSFRSAEEVQGFLYKYNKEFILRLYHENDTKASYLVKSIFNKKVVDIYFDNKTTSGLTPFAFELVSNISGKDKHKFLKKLTKADIEFLTSELRGEHKNNFLSSL